MKQIHLKLKEIETEYLDLQNGINEYINNNLKASELKPKGSKFGIYEQKHKKMMLRLKAVGGELSLANIQSLYNIMSEFEIPYLHLSTRQNYQLHEVEFSKVKSVIEACNSNGMYFRGGGGNTFRSILVSVFTGVDSKNLFDIMPYAKMIENEVFFMDKAFNFGRKLKIGFSNNITEEFNMPIQDMGFVAKELNGQKGFQVFSGGGMGRNSRLGYVLIDFLPVENLLKSVKAMINLFYDHGDRKNRMKARLRFLVEQMGISEFKKLFFDYYNKQDVEDIPVQKSNYIKLIENLKTFDTTLESSEFKTWKDICTQKTKFKNILSLTLYVKNGVITREELLKLKNILEKLNIPFVRATINQNLVLPLIHKSALPIIYDFLEKELPQIVTNNFSLNGQIRACIGSKVCMIGIQDSPKIANEIEKSLDELVCEFPKFKKLIFKEAKNIRISGCPSACAGIPVAPLGFIGTKKRIDDEIKDCMTVYVGGILTESIQSLSSKVLNLTLTINEIPNFVKQQFKNYLNSLEEYNLSFAEYMYKNKNNIK